MNIKFVNQIGAFRRSRNISSASKVPDRRLAGHAGYIDSDFFQSLPPLLDASWPEYFQAYKSVELCGLNPDLLTPYFLSVKIGSGLISDCFPWPSPATATQNVV